MSSQTREHEQFDEVQERSVRRIGGLTGGHRPARGEGAKRTDEQRRRERQGGGAGGE